MAASSVFADTSFYLALMRSEDSAHARAKAEAHAQELVLTTEFIVLELGNACSRASDHRDFLKLLDGMRKSGRVTVVPLDSHLLERGLKRTAERADKDWSLTDCISFVVMEDMGISSALTTDRHFEQAGFRAILRDGQG